MAIVNLISTNWSEKLLDTCNQNYVGVNNCSRDYEGDIHEKGSMVKVCGLMNNISVHDHTKNGEIQAAEALSDTVRTLKIDQAQYFNFKIDCQDRALTTPKLMDEAIRVATAGLVNAADTYVYSLYMDSTQEISENAPTSENVADGIAQLMATLLKNGAKNCEDIAIEVTPEVGVLLFRSKMLEPPKTNEPGAFGTFMGSTVYVSNNIIVDEENYHCCLVRTKRAVAFVEKFVTRPYSPENSFADAVKSLHLYGAKIVYPNEFGVYKALIS